MTDISICDISIIDMDVKDRPIAAAALQILLALSESDLHGYGIMQSVKQQSGGKFKLGPGTLYANLDRLLASGLVGETERKYRLTPDGEKVLREEIRRLRQVVAVAGRRLAQLDERDA